MPLSRNSLVDRFEAAFDANPETPAEAGALFAEALRIWVSDAKSCATPGLPTNGAALEPALASAFTAAFFPGPNPATSGAAMDVGTATFFLGLIFSGVSPTAPSVPPNVVAGVPGFGGAIAAEAETKRQAAENLADAVFDWISGGAVTVSHLGLPPPPPAGIPCSAPIS